MGKKSERQNKIHDERPEMTEGIAERKNGIFKNRDAVLVLIYFFVFIFFAAKVPFVVGALVLGYYFSTVLSVPYDYVLRKTNKKYLAVASYVLVVLVFVYAVVSFFPMIINQIREIVASAEKTHLNFELPKWVSELLNEVKANISSFLGSIVKYVVGIVPSLITMVMLLVVTMIGIESIRAYFGRKVNLLFVDDPKYGELFARTFFSEVKRYLRGQVLVSFISATLTTIGLYAIGVPSAFTLGVLSFIGGFFPFVGLLFTAVPMYLLAFTSRGLIGIVWLTVLLVGVNQTESWLYGPRIQGNNLKLHWFVILISIFLLGSILGFVGVLIALPILLFIRSFWRFYVLGASDMKSNAR
ncbi:MAG: AI-2E family transporter [Fervidobacterium sp.]|uniref:Predicted PurR-regulated permease PerM n=1 Tax=Fervidobacterium gondwanense DSM 13020 TaxID=1121883 RepID=A0A1M7RTB6_FERGO|nr:AI-2E family transporter [Fervidobacterium gondwanense]SHN49535.1 Predicted PurR-regulated permease PerM [Fervidobacterium gondwanense DSM 13020]